MAKIQYLNKRGLETFAREIKKRTANIYMIKGSAIYADEAYLTNPDKEANIDSVGLWQEINNAWTKITEVKPGWVYNIKNNFTTDEDFVEGAGSDIVAGINIVAVNLGNSDVPNMKWDLLAMGVSLEDYQTKKLVAPIETFENGTPTTYSTAEDLPDEETVIGATITDMMIAIIGGTSAETGDVYRASVVVSSDDDTKNEITWIKIGRQDTVEGALELISKTAPNTPISDNDIIELFND